MLIKNTACTLFARRVVAGCDIDIPPRLAGLIPGHLIEVCDLINVQRSPLFCASIVKKDPGRAKQTSLATAVANFTKP